VFTMLSSTEATDGLPQPLRRWHHILSLAKPWEAKPLERVSLSTNPVRRRLRTFMTHPWMDSTMMALIVTNVMLLAVQYYDQPDSWTTFCETLLEMISWTFCLEMVCPPPVRRPSE
jgi:hypothetical protein